MVQDFDYTGITNDKKKREYALALDLTVVAQCIILREKRLAIHA